MANKIQLRRDTASNWSRINPILADGEPGLDITNNKLKMGDGTTAWNSLPFSGGEPTRLVNGTAVLTLATNGKISAPGLEIDASGDFSAIYSNSNTPGTAKQIYISPSDGDTGLRLPPDAQAGSNPVHLFNINTGGVRVTSGSNERFWEFDAGGHLVIPTNGVVRSTPGTDGTLLNISGIAVDPTNNNRVTVTTSANHGITQNGTKVYISGLTRCTALNDSYYYVMPGAINNFVLYTDTELNNQFDGAALTEEYSVPGNRATTAASAPHFPYSTTDQTPFAGNNTMYFDGSSYIRVAPSNDFDFNVGPFTVSFWVYQQSYASNPRIFTFGTWPNETLGMSSETYSTTYTWLNGGYVGDGLGGLSLNTWHYVVITRYQNMISISIDGNKGNTFNGVGYDLYMAATKTLTIGNDGAGSAGFQGYIRDFKINVGAGFDVTTLSSNLPTGPATADASTKLLLLHSPNDISGSATVTGGGHVMEKIPSSNVIIQTADNPNGSDYGSVNLLSGVTGLKVDSKFNRVSVMNPGGEFPVNGTGQYTVQLNASSEGVLFTIPNNEYNLVYIKLEDGYTGSGSQAIELGYPPRPGMEMTVINNSPNSVDVIGWDGPSYTMMAWESIRLMSLSDPGYGNYWWVTSSFTW